MLANTIFKENLTQFRSYSAKLLAMPIWVKQAIYIVLKENLSECTNVVFLEDNSFPPIQLFEPNLSVKGVKVTKEEEVLPISIDQKSFLKCCKLEYNLLEITQINNWNFRKTLIILLEAIEAGFVEDISQNNVKNLIMYFTGRIRIGELLVRLNKINTQQLDKALYAYKYAVEMDGNTDFTEILAKYANVDHHFLISIEELKNSSMKSIDVIDDGLLKEEESSILRDQASDLALENSRLKEQLEFYITEVDKKRRENLELNKQLQKYTKGFVGRFLANLS